MAWMRLRLEADAENAGAVAELVRAFAAAWEREGYPKATALFGREDPAGGWTLLAMGTTPPAIAEAVARFGFTEGYARKPEGLRLLVGHPVAARVVAPDVKRSRRWWAEARGDIGKE